MTIPGNPKIYVAGHRGLVGSALVRALHAQGHENLILRTHAELDLLDQAATARFFAETRPEVVFLAAAKVGGIHANNVQRGQFIYENLTMQTHVLHQAYLAGVKRLIFLGSSCIYPKFAPQPIHEDALLTGPLEPTNLPYAIAKIAGVEMCDAYNRQYGTAYVPVMPTNLYGPNDNFDLKSSHVLPALIRKFHLARLAQVRDWASIAQDVARFGPIPADLQQSLGIPPHSPTAPRVTIWGTGAPRREFLHVDDMATACVHIGLCTTATALINIGTGVDVTIRELADRIAGIVGYSGPIDHDPTKPDGTPQKLLDVSRLAGLGWRARIDLATGLRDTYAWYQAATGKPDC
ncbi:MAG: GDP-L-fucose synthase [Candidatus Contendobacter sp.]|nr:GDP-L-fucose synthase [Candidatus Contendobacter sp.]MDG4558509.1 GDP-L-fucose synthase [Candidatus Contendobacter sp.]